MKNKKAIRARVSVSEERVTRSILLIRGQKVILDEDLAALYEVETGLLNRAVRRNLNRFPVWHLKFEIPNWDLKTGRSSILALRLYRAGHRHAFQRVK